MNNEEQDREPGLFISKIHFEVLKIDVKVKFGNYLFNEGNYNYDFNIKDLQQAQIFFIDVVKEATNLGTFDFKAIAGIANQILAHFEIVSDL